MVFFTELAIRLMICFKALTRSTFFQNKLTESKLVNKTYLKILLRTDRVLFQILEFMNKKIHLDFPKM